MQLRTCLELLIDGVAYCYLSFMAVLPRRGDVVSRDGWGVVANTIEHTWSEKHDQWVYIIHCLPMEETYKTADGAFYISKGWVKKWVKKN